MVEEIHCVRRLRLLGFFPMKCLLLVSLLVFLGFGFVAKTDSQVFAPEPTKVRINAELAEKLLLKKAPLACPKVAMPARATGTVVLAILIGRTGEVLSSRVISGPAMLLAPVVKAVRKYRYKPYILNRKAVEVETVVSVSVDTYLDCPNYR
jgi:protein TonB